MGTIDYNQGTAVIPLVVEVQRNGRPCCVDLLHQLVSYFVGTTPAGIVFAWLYSCIPLALLPRLELGLFRRQRKVLPIDENRIWYRGTDSNRSSWSESPKSLPIDDRDMSPLSVIYRRPLHSYDRLRPVVVQYLGCDGGRQRNRTLTLSRRSPDFESGSRPFGAAFQGWCVGMESSHPSRSIWFTASTRALREYQRIVQRWSRRRASNPHTTLFALVSKTSVSTSSTTAGQISYSVLLVPRMGVEPTRPVRVTGF
jgi:hypothetical protein